MIPDKTVRKLLKKQTRIEVAEYLTRKHGYTLEKAVKQLKEVAVNEAETSKIS
jgi:hypothetical protein